MHDKTLCPDFDSSPGPLPIFALPVIEGMEDLHLNEVRGTNKDFNQTRGENMEIKDEHRALIKAVGLKEEDSRLFEGEKGFRLYAPHCLTSDSES